LILAVAGGVFAQELTWSGIVETGVRVSVPDEGAGRVDIHNDNDDVVSRARIQATYDADTYGAKVGIGTDFNNSFGVYNAYAWYNFLGGIINVKGGQIDDAVWNTAGPEDWNLSNDIGVRLEVTPITGLNIGLLLTNSSTTLDDVASDFLLETAFGVSYTSEIFDVSAALKLDSEADYWSDFSDQTVAAMIAQYRTTTSDTTSTDDAVKGIIQASGQGPSSDTGVEAIFGFAYKGLPALTAKAEGRVWGLADFSDYGFVWLNEDLAYQILDPLKVGAVFTEQFFGDSDVAKPYFKVKPYLEYKISDPILVGVEVPVWFQQDAIDLGVGGRPWIKYSFNDDAYIKAFYDLAYESPNVGDATTKQTIQIDFVVKF
jgi:hypothetical protein